MRKKSFIKRRKAVRHILRLALFAVITTPTLAGLLNTNIGVNTNLSGSVLGVEVDLSTGLDAALSIDDPGLQETLDTAIAYLQLPDTIDDPLPSNPYEALIDAITGLYSDLGIVKDDIADKVYDAKLPYGLSGRLANTLRSVRQCASMTREGLKTLSVSDLKNLYRGVQDYYIDLSVFSGLKDCTDHLWNTVAALEAAAKALKNGGVPLGCGEFDGLDIWPIVRVEGVCDDVYRHDYMVQIDLGGNDTYDNNAGSNMIDIRNGPIALLPEGTSPFAFFERVGPAQGCQEALTGLTAGDCVPLAAVTLDLEGNDQYGVFKTPDIDASCTADPVIRRMVTGGVGFAGVGILRDVKGNDRYYGKTGTLGAGHVAGIGILSDAEGNDSYLAVRNGQGFGLAGVLGVLHDVAGNDVYDYYLPSALDPAAANQSPGAGGVIDDEGVCDNVPRFVQGGANLGGAGLLLDDGGDDRYRGAEGVEFIAPFNASGVGGSQGFGLNGGFGALLDLAGDDHYEGVSDRGNGIQVLPNSPSTNTGIFVDF
ncbi:MAG: hypothetical protein ACU843_13010 [Gammaproteobacteria bacterium]